MVVEPLAVQPSLLFLQLDWAEPYQIWQWMMLWLSAAQYALAWSPALLDLMSFWLLFQLQERLYQQCLLQT